VRTVRVLGTCVQVKDDGEAVLIDAGDHTVNEWIMDAVTHQPIFRQTAVKGLGSVFYWDLNAPSLETNAQIKFADRRKNYEEWIAGFKAQDDPNQLKKYKYLVGVTQRKNINNWESFVVRILIREKEKKEQASDRRLGEGEIRIELGTLMLKKAGVAKLASLNVPDEEEDDEESAFGAAWGRLNSFAAESLHPDTSLVLIKLQLPGDDELVSQPVRVSKRDAPKARAAARRALECMQAHARSSTHTHRHTHTHTHTHTHAHARTRTLGACMHAVDAWHMDMDVSMHARVLSPMVVLGAARVRSRPSSIWAPARCTT
jgi:hypothetical protein